MRALTIVVGVIIVGAAAYGVFLLTKESSEMPADVNMNILQKARIETNNGTVVVELYSKDAPKTVANFIKRAQEGFDSGAKFHRVIKDFMIQGGDPLTKDDTKALLWGTGGPGYQFEDELNTATKSYQDGYRRGVVAMANAGPNTNGSQFFIMHRDNPLPHNYTIFGKVVEGIETVDAIANAPVDTNNRPTTPVVIKRITIE